MSGRRAARRAENQIVNADAQISLAAFRGHFGDPVSAVFDVNARHAQIRGSTRSLTVFDSFLCFDKIGLEIDLVSFIIYSNKLYIYNMMIKRKMNYYAGVVSRRALNDGYIIRFFLYLQKNKKTRSFNKI